MNAAAKMLLTVAAEFAGFSASRDNLPARRVSDISHKTRERTGGGQEHHHRPWRQFPNGEQQEA
jgi:hypothetical protein